MLPLEGGQYSVFLPASRSRLAGHAGEALYTSPLLMDTESLEVSRISGVIGVHSEDGEDATKTAFKALVSLQNRGEAGCGICTASNGKLLYWLSPLSDNPELGHSAEGRESSKVFEFLYPRLEKIDATRPKMIVGHTLFEKSGNIQPLRIKSRDYEIAIAMDGTIVGRSGLLDERYLGKEFLIRLRKEEGDIRAAARDLMEDFYGRGYYSATMLIKHEERSPVMIAIRDPTGVRPLCLGSRDGTYVVSSESVALDETETSFIKFVEPGEICMFDSEFRSEKLVSRPHAHCIFEWIYFARIQSVIEGAHVYDFRRKQGIKMGERYRDEIQRAGVIGASPDSGRAFGIGLSQAAGKPAEEIASKNGRRTFQITDEKLRDLAAEVKFLINGPVVKDRWVIVTDDSIVRGTVGGKGMIGKIKESGAERVDMMVSCAPLTGPCMKDFFPRSTTAAFGRYGDPVEDIAKSVAERLGADRVYYTTVSDMFDSLDVNCGVCTGCFTGQYPIKKELLPDYLPDYVGSTLE